MRAWLNKQFSKVDNWRDDKRANDKVLYYFIWAVFWVVIFFLKKILEFLFSDFSSNFQWGWLVKILIIIGVVFVYGLIFWLDKTKAKKSKTPMSWEPWMLIVFLSILFLMHHSKVAPIPEPNAILESLNTDPPSGEHIDRDAVSEFNKGDYAYSILFFKKVERPDADASWQGNKPIYFAANLALNPTAGGYDNFNTNLDGLVLQIVRETKSNSGDFNDIKQVKAAIDNLRLVRDKLPITERAHITDVIRQVEKLENDKWP